MIEVIHVSKRFYSLKAIDDVSLNVPQGEVVGILGPNGAGKTTLLKLIAGILNPDNGRIAPIGGRRWPTIGYKPERLLFPNQLRVSQYLEMMARLANVPKSAVSKIVFDSLARVDMVDAAGKKIGTCSKGMRQRLALAQVLIGEPSLLLLDEPSSGLDPTGQTDMNRRIQELHAAGKTILLCSHQLQEVTQVCTFLVVLNQGKIQYQSSMADALAIRSHTVIRSDRDLASIQETLLALHQDVHIDGDTIILKNEAMGLRRQILTMLLSADYDIVYVAQKQRSLAEIYAEVIR